MTISYKVRCHCGDVRAIAELNNDRVVAWECDCSDCSMRGNVHVVIPQSAFRLDMPGQPIDATQEDHEKELSEKTTLYLWGTKTAQRQFCKQCGILPWYRPRSNPDGYGLTLKCIDFENPILPNNNTENSNSSDSKITPPMVEIRRFDGQNWEKFFEQSGISEQSKV